MEHFRVGKPSPPELDLEALAEQIERTTGRDVHFRYPKPDGKMGGWRTGKLRIDPDTGKLSLLVQKWYKQREFIVFEAGSLQSIDIITMRGSDDYLVGYMMEMLLLFYLVLRVLTNLAIPTILRWVVAIFMMLLYIGASTLRARAPVPGVRIRHMGKPGEPEILEFYVKGFVRGLDEGSTLGLAKRMYQVIAQHDFRGAAPATEDDSSWRGYRKVLKAAVTMDVLLGLFFLGEYLIR